MPSRCHVLRVRRAPQVGGKQLRCARLLRGGLLNHVECVVAAGFPKTDEAIHAALRLRGESPGRRTCGMLLACCNWWAAAPPFSEGVPRTGGRGGAKGAQRGV
eukprot:10323603-Alexandrium_andersonii.AAC.2